MGELIPAGMNVTPVAPLVSDDPDLWDREWLESALPSARVSFEKSKIPEFGGIPPFNRKWSNRTPALETPLVPQVGVGRKDIAHVQETERAGFARRMAALDTREQLMATYLEENPQVNAAYMEASLTKDLNTKSEIEAAIIERLGEVYGNVNEYEVEPTRYEVSKKVMPRAKPGQRQPSPHWVAEDYPMTTTEKHLQELGGKVLVKNPIVAPLMSPADEKIYNEISKGTLFNVSAKPTMKRKDGKIVDNPNYLDDEMLFWYAGQLTQRTKDYSKHKHYHPLRQRMGEWLASKGYSTKGIKARELARGVIPFQQDWERHMTDPKEREEREKVRSVMNLMDENAEGHHIAGKVIGILGTAGFGYASLTARGLTSFLGANARTTQSLFATGYAELGIDAAYNPDGYTMLLGSMLNVDQDRMVSGIEALALGTAFNLGIDMVRLIKGTQMKDVTKLMERLEVVDEQRIHHLRERARLAKKEGNIATAKETANAPVSNLPVKPLTASPETNLRISEMFKEGEVGRLLKLNEIETALDYLSPLMSKRQLGLLRKQLGSTLSERLPKRQLSLIRKQLEGMRDFLRQSQPLLAPNVTRAARGEALEVMTREELMKSLPHSPGHTAPETLAATDDVMKMLGNVMPERNAVNMEKLIKEAKEGAPYVKEGFTRQLAREALRREVLPQFGLMAIGGGAGLTMARDEKEMWGHFIGGMMLPLAAKQGVVAMARTFSRAGGYAGVPLVSTFHRIDPDIAWGVHKQQVKVVLNTHSRMERAQPFLTEMNDLVARHVITEADKKKIYDLLQDGKKLDAVAEIRKIDGSSTMGKHYRGYLTAMFDEHEKVIREMGEEAERIGYGMGNLGETYFPRSVKDHDGMMEKIYDLAEGDDRVTRAWAAGEGLKGEPLSFREKAHIANEVFSHSGYGKVAGRPSNASTRLFDERPDELKGFYHDYEHTINQYIPSMTDSFESHKFLGKGVTAHWLRQAVEIDPGVKDVVHALNLRNPERLEKTVGGLFPDAWARLSKKPRARELVVKRLHQFYNQPVGRAMGGFQKTVRDLGYMATIGNFYSTFTQMSDILLSAALNSHGMGGSIFANIFKSRKNLHYSLADWGLDAKGVQKLALEFEDQSLTTKWLATNLETTGFMAVDRHSKRVLVNAALDDFLKAANADMSTISGRSAFKQLEREFEGMGSEDFAEMVQVLRGDPKLAKSNFDVQAMVLSRLWKQHPINKAHMPLGYVKHPKGRLMYMLKTFTIKQIDLLRRSTLDEISAGWKAGDTGRWQRGIVNMGKYAAYFGVSQQGINAGKDWLLNREVSMSDRKVSAVAQAMGLHRMYFHMFQDTFDPKNKSSFTKNSLEMGWNLFAPAPASILMKTVMPDVFSTYEGMASDHDQDIFQSYGENFRLLGVETPVPDKIIPWVKGRQWRYLPWIGKDIYWSIGRGRDIEAARHPEPGSAPRVIPIRDDTFKELPWEKGR